MLQEPFPFELVLDAQGILKVGLQEGREDWWVSERVAGLAQSLSVCFRLRETWVQTCLSNFLHCKVGVIMTNSANS